MLHAPIDLKSLSDEELRNMAKFSKGKTLAKIRLEYKRRLLRRMGREGVKK